MLLNKSAQVGGFGCAVVLVLKKALLSVGFGKCYLAVFGVCDNVTVFIVCRLVAAHQMCPYTVPIPFGKYVALSRSQSATAQSR